MLEDTKTAMEPDIIPQFRAAKRRKVFRTRNQDSDNEDESSKPARTSASPQASDNDADKPAFTMASHVRRPPRKLGVGATVASSSAQVRELESQASSILAITSSAADLVGKRFAPQTGLVVDDTEKHM
jgi:hypothetical protein